MRLLAVIRSIQAPLISLVIACLVSAGCQTRQERLSLDEPWDVFLAEDGTVMMGYYIQPTISPSHKGWHWLVVESELAEQMFQPVSPDNPDAVVVVDYEGWFSKAKLMPKLTQPGGDDPTPPTLGYGRWIELDFEWDEAEEAFRLIDSSGGVLPLVRVTPGFAVLKTRNVRSEFGLALLRIAAVAGLVAGIVLLDGSFMFSTYGGSYGY